jgi:hypothetical protein
MSKAAIDVDLEDIIYKPYAIFAFVLTVMKCDMCRLKEYKARHNLLFVNGGSDIWYRFERNIIKW